MFKLTLTAIIMAATFASTANATECSATVQHYVKPLLSTHTDSQIATKLATNAYITNTYFSTCTMIGDTKIYTVSTYVTHDSTAATALANNSTAAYP